jgi:MFS transporter, OFA family, oxalate/formate antiporter
MAVAVVNQGKTQAVSKLRYTGIILSSLIIMLCSGSVYAWSIFVSPLKSVYHLSTAETQLVYGCILGIFCVANVFVHNISDRFGPRITASMGALIFGMGYLVASFSEGNFLLLVVGLGLFSGIGMSLGYMTILTNLVKWMPNNRGLATGMAVAGFGGGTIIMTQIAQPLLNQGTDVLMIFRTIGILYGILYLVGAMFLNVPPWETTKVNRTEGKLDLKQLLSDRRFWVLFYTAFAASFSGLMFYGNAKPLGISSGVNAGAALIAVILMSAGNAVGRLTWGQISDMIGSRKAIILSIFLVSALILLMLVGIKSDISFIVLVFVFGFCFGADQVLYASNVADEWGVQKMAAIYPIVFLAYGVSGLVAPTLGGQIFDATGSYNLAIIICGAVCLSGIPVYALLMPHRAKSRKSKIAIAPVVKY